MSRYLKDNELPTLILHVKAMLDELDEIKGHYRIKERNDKAFIFEVKEELLVNQSKKNILTVWISATPKIRAIGSRQYDKETPFLISDLSSLTVKQDLLYIYRSMVQDITSL